MSRRDTSRSPADRLLCTEPRLLTLMASALLVLASTSAADSTPPASQADTSSGITLERIMADTDWLGGAPQGFYWSSDGSTVFFDRDPADLEDDDDRWWRLDIASGEMTEVPLAELSSVEPFSGDWSEDRTRRVYALNGDVYLIDVTMGQRRQLTRTSARESGPRFLSGDDRVAFSRGGTWYVRELETGLEFQPADVIAGDDPAEKEPDDDYLSEQQRRLFEVVREDRATEDRRAERRRERRRVDPHSVPSPFYLGKGRETLRSTLSPSGEAQLLLMAPENRDEGRQDKMPNYVGADGYVEIEEVRRKVGVGGDYTHSLVFLDLVDHELHKVDLSVLPGIDEDPLADLKAATEAAKKAEADDRAAESEPSPENSDASKQADEEDTGKKDDTKPRHVRIFGFEWSPDGSHVAFLVRSRDNKDRWLVSLSRDDPEPETIHRLTMNGWINWSHNDFGWLPDGRLYFLSEESGYSHLYVYDPENGETTALTSGEFVVSDPQHDPAGENFYVTANPERPTSYDVYRVGSRGGSLQRVTETGGTVQFELSPDGSQLLLRNSQLLEPPELFLQAVTPGSEVRQLTDTTSEPFESLPFIAPEIVQVPSSHHDRPIWGRYYPPKNPDLLRGPDGKIPAVIFVHGAGYLQNAHEGWSGYFREFMFHTFLAERGYAVLDVDYRGSKGYGAEWRQAIYRHMGQPELEDLLDGRSWLASEHDVDPERVGIYGGSYGGFMVMMALFKEPGAFAAGAALRPVTDWAHYNHGYTSNILNTPAVDPEAYARSSPIEFADGLEDPLLICAPMLDDNVLFQDVVRLVQKLIELDKTSFEVALFPIEPHGFRRPSGWLHEYRRIYHLFDEELGPE
ncbi:MAG: S9 family peptidase [Thermoanaerobaculia bacterium]|nr:S9 family peptidase [Thermoanaerobaculia bacterium]